MMNENETAGGFGWLIILLIFIVVIGGLMGGFGGGLFGGNRGADAVACGHTCGCVSNCEVQKQEIIDNARNLYASEQNANRVIANQDANTQRLYDQSARQYEAGLQADLFDLKINAQTTAILNGQALQAKDAEIASLKQTMHLNDKFCYVNGRLNEIECQMLKKPHLYGVAATCAGEFIPSISSAT